MKTADQKGTLVELRYVSQVYGRDERRIVAVKDISFALRSGEFVALLGPTGCGKTTILRIITGLNQPANGEVLYGGRRLRGVNPHATIVAQTFSLFPWLTVLENVMVPLKARGVRLKERRMVATQLIDKVGLDGFESAYPRELSGGMRQKVGFARAMVMEPELLCLDEPFSALDVLSADALRGELLELWTGGAMPTKTILMVTHNIEEAAFMADRILIMDKAPGRIIAEVPITLPQPRHRKSPEFLALVDTVYAVVAGETQPEPIELGSAPGEPGKTRALPHVSINAIAGLLEHLAEHPEGRYDLYRLAEELRLEIDDLLPIVESAEMLGFAVVTSGDVVLQPLGETFAEASILARKEIFATRARRVPLIRWILGGLRSSPESKMPRDMLETVLQWEFSAEEATRQMDTAINWGRYSELLAFDDDSESVYLEPAEASQGSA
jgi:NitT/TauT family transport system ATP-binding protein